MTQPSGYITKPIDGRELKKAVEMALDWGAAEGPVESGEA
jgi:hypothetical protein